MKKLIDEKKFLEEISNRIHEDNIVSPSEVETILSKHLKDLPEKKSDSGDLDYTHVVAYNQCLEDCGGK